MRANPNIHNSTSGRGDDVVRWLSVSGVDACLDGGYVESCDVAEGAFLLRCDGVTAECNRYVGSVRSR